MTLTPEKLASLREAIAALQAEDIEFEYRSPWYTERNSWCSEALQVRSCRNSLVADAEGPEAAAYIAAVDPQTVLALVEEVERLRDIETDLLVCDADCRDLQSFVEEQRAVIERLQARVAELEKNQ